MSPRRSTPSSPPAVASAKQRIAVQVGAVVREQRARRRWSLHTLARRARLSPSVVHGIEAGRVASIDSYARIANTLGMRLDLTLADATARVVAHREADLVHSAMGELQATRLRDLGYTVSIDEPYQHFQFAGRADVVAWSLEREAMLHIENRTRFPDLQSVAGSYNAKRLYMPMVLAERIGLRRGFRCEAHVIAGLWSAEVIHSVRMRRASFQAICPDPPWEFESWWRGGRPDERRTSSFILFDPFATGRQARWTDLTTTLTSARPRVRGYAEAAGRLGSGLRVVGR